MAVTDFLQAYGNRTNPSAVGPLVQSPKPTNTIKRVSLGASNVAPVGPLSQSPANQITPGSTVQAILNNTKGNAQATYEQSRQSTNQDLAQRVLQQSAGNVPVDQYGIVQRPTDNSQQIINGNLGTIDQTGKTALAGAQDKATWQKLLQMQNLNSNYNVSTVFGTSYDPANLPAGSTNNNKGAQAVAIAMTAFKNGTKYVWGGNSLTNGVDCSGLMQQAYAKLGIKLPRTTYEQAKSGQIIQGIGNALPGDLIFYNTGSSDPNGIGKNSHVAMYLGNGMVLEAYNSRVGIRKASVNADGTPSTIVRPWS